MTSRIAAAFAIGLAWLGLAAPAQALKSETQNGIPVVTGGVGVPETQELHRMRFKHTLRVTTANTRTGTTCLIAAWSWRRRPVACWSTRRRRGR